MTDLSPNQNTESLHYFLRSRRSIRRYKPDPVPTSIINRILETAIYAPSAHNLQPWRFANLASMDARALFAAAVTDRFRRDMLSEGSEEFETKLRIERTRRRILDAPVIIVICRDSGCIKPHRNYLLAHVEEKMGIQSVALAGLQLLLAAHAEGLGGTWICWPFFAPEETRLSLGLPDFWEPEGMFFLGYSAETPETPARTPLHEVMKTL